MGGAAMLVDAWPSDGTSQFVGTHLALTFETNLSQRSRRVSPSASRLGRPDDEHRSSVGRVS